jgi:hypothetical protein
MKGMIISLLLRRFSGTRIRRRGARIMRPVLLGEAAEPVGELATAALGCELAHNFLISIPGYALANFADPKMAEFLFPYASNMLGIHLPSVSVPSGLKNSSLPAMK